MLPNRDIEILRAIVDLHVRHGVPVSSLRVQRHLGTPLSTATIRNVMARLEQNGFLRKPHTSAGRVPTDKGYRSYVDRLDPNLAFADRFSETFKVELRVHDGGVETVMSAASRALSSMSKHFAMVYGSLEQESRVSRIQLVELDGGRLLVAVHVEPDHERTTVLRLDRRFGPSVIRRAEAWINREVQAKTLTDARAAIDAAIRDNITDEGIITREVAARRDEIFSELPAVEFYFEETEPLDRPEFADPRVFHMLLRLLQNKRYLATLLSSRAGSTQVTIGDEHEDAELRPFSLVTAGYRLGAARGVLGVIGPTRMPYDLICALVGSAARGLETVGDEYF